VAPSGATTHGAATHGAATRETGTEGGPAATRPASGAVRESARAVVRGGAFRWIAVAFALSGLTTMTVSVHLVPLLVERGHGAAFAGGAMGVLGLMALPGRLVFTPLRDRWSRGAVTASIFALQAGAVVALLATRSTLGVWVFVALFGAGFGAITPARAALIGELVAPAAYGRVSGVLALVISLAHAAAPVGASLLHAAGGGPRHGYDAVLLALLALCGASGIAVLAAHPASGAALPGARPVHDDGHAEQADRAADHGGRVRPVPVHPPAPEQ